MAFLDNSGDIILDAVLTDTGRARLARGDGSFKIVKFALGDDEIDYESFDGNNASGSAFFDLEILQTPVFEAFTNNTSTMKSKLISLTNNNLLYLPVVKLNKLDLADAAPTSTDAGSNAFGSGSHVLVVDNDTKNALDSSALGVTISSQGFLNGFDAPTKGRHIRVDQGLDTSEVSPTFTIDPELKETQYIIEIDSRFAKIYDANGDGAVASPSFIDDDLIASYYFAQNVGSYIENMGQEATDKAKDFENNIAGPRGTKFKFGLQASTDVVASDFLFETIGSTVTPDGNTYFFLDTTVRVTGVTTGYQLDIPVRLLKLND
tara:strand:- start:2584 stop:3543 length:960 start_codon:yes stop_codon:yes gene_type:complete